MFDALTLAAIVDELNATIVGGRVQRVLLLDDLSLGLEIYAGHRRHQLLISAHPQHARLHLVDTRLTADRERITPFLLLLRKYLRGGQVLAITQPPLERTVAVSIAKFLPLDKPGAGGRGSGVGGQGSGVGGQGSGTESLPHPGPLPEGEGTATESPQLLLPLGEGRSEGATGDWRPATAPSSPAPDPQPPPPDEELPGYEVVVTLIVEIMGRHSNIALVDSRETILDSIKRVPARVNRYRTVLPNRPYVPPPDQPKADPLTVGAGWWTALHRRVAPEASIAPALVRELRGLSPQVAREVAFRAAGAVDAPFGALPDERALPAALDEVLGHLVQHDWAPHLYLRDGQPAAFSPFPLRSLATLPTERFDSISAAAAAFVGGIGAVTGHGQSKARLIERLTEERARLVARRRALEEQLQAGAAAEAHRQAGEMIYAYLHTLRPGQTRLETDGLSIEIDPQRSPVENAQAYFERYRRARAATEHLPELVQATDLELAYVDQLLAFAQFAEGLEEIQAIEQEWREHERAQGTGAQRKPPARRGPRRLRTPRGDIILIGRNGQQNDQVTFDLAGPDDLWLHARGLPGAHVILQARGAPDNRLIEAAAQLAAYYSPARSATAVEVDVTERRWVKKIKGGPPGLVTYRNERTVRVAPAAEETLRARGLLAAEPAAR